MVECEKISNKELIAAIASGKVTELIPPEQFNALERKKQCSRIVNFLMAALYAVVFEGLLALVIGTPLYFLWGVERLEFWVLGYFALVFVLYLSNQWGGTSQYNKNVRLYAKFYERFRNAARAASQPANVGEVVQADVPVRNTDRAA